MSPLLVAAVQDLGEAAVLTMSSNITAGIMELINPFQKSLTVEQTGHRIPIVASLSDVTPEMAIYGRACILRNEQLILVWSTSSETIMDVGSDVEMQLYTLVRTMRTFDCLLLIHLSSCLATIPSQRYRQILCQAVTDLEGHQYIPTTAKKP